MDVIINFVKDNVPDNVGYIILFILGFFEFSKIKFSPISSTLSWIGNRINKPLMKKIGEQDEKLNKLSTEFQDHRIGGWRSEILTFANQAMNGRNHTLEEFEHIIRVHDKYYKYITERNIPNGQINMAFDYIEKLYQKNRRINGFLNAKKSTKRLIR